MEPSVRPGKIRGIPDPEIRSWQLVLDDIGTTGVQLDAVNVDLSYAPGNQVP